MLKDFLQRHVTGIDITAGIVIVLLAMATTFFYLDAQGVRRELATNQQAVVSQQVNNQVLDFAKLFVDKVLRAKGEIDFETRLALESSVRAIKDDQLLSAWQSFTDSKTEGEAQERVKELLSLIISKIK